MKKLKFAIMFSVFLGSGVFGSGAVTKTLPIEPRPIDTRAERFKVYVTQGFKEPGSPSEIEAIKKDPKVKGFLEELSTPIAYYKDILIKYDAANDAAKPKEKKEMKESFGLQPDLTDSVFKRNLKERLINTLNAVRDETKAFIKKLTESWLIPLNGFSGSKERYLASFTGTNGGIFSVDRTANKNFLGRLFGKEKTKRNKDSPLFKKLADIYRSLNTKVIARIDNLRGNDIINPLDKKYHIRPFKDNNNSADMVRTGDKASTDAGMREIYKEFGTRRDLLIFLSIVEERIKEIIGTINTQQ